MAGNASDAQWAILSENLVLARCPRRNARPSGAVSSGHRL